MISRLILSVLLVLPSLEMLLTPASGKGATSFRLPPGQTKPSASAAQQSDPVAMLLRLFDYLDQDGDGIVPLADLFEALDLSHAEARQVNRARALDRNHDGRLTRAEVDEGVKAEIAYQTQRRMNTDADGDGSVTPTEYALAVADPNGKADASGLTPLQRSAFNFDDLNGDGKVTREEVQTRFAHSYTESYWALWMVVRARRADRNQDGLLDEQEFAQIEGNADLAALRQRFAAAGAKDGKLTVQNLQLLFLRLSANERDQAEKQMTAFEERFKTQPKGTTQP